MHIQVSIHMCAAHLHYRAFNRLARSIEHAIDAE